MNDPHPQSKPTPTPESIVAAITARGAAMKPHWRFALGRTAIVASAVALVLGLFYLGSLIAYLVRVARLWDLTHFGPRGYSIFLQNFPWWHALAVLAGLAGLIYLIRHFTAGYRWPLAVTIGVALLALVGVGVLLATIGLHESFERAAEENRLPVLAPLYPGGGPTRGVRMLVTVGTVTKVSGSTLTLRTESGDTVKVRISDDTQGLRGWTPAVDDRIAVVGENRNGTIDAVAVRSAWGRAPGPYVPDGPSVFLPQGFDADAAPAVAAGGAPQPVRSRDG